MDITETIKVNSDQLNADDLIGTTLTITITAVTKGTSEQPVFIHAQELPNKTYRPSKSMRRVLVACWGCDGNTYVGRSLTLYRNPEIRFGKEKVGGIEISHASHIDKPTTVSLQVARGKRRPFTVQPLTVAPVVTVADVEACEDVDQLREWWQTATDDVKTAITARANKLADLHSAAEANEGEPVQGELIEDEGELS